MLHDIFLDKVRFHFFVTVCKMQLRNSVTHTLYLIFENVISISDDISIYYLSVFAVCLQFFFHVLPARWGLIIQILLINAVRVIN